MSSLEHSSRSARRSLHQWIPGDWTFLPQTVHAGRKRALSVRTLSRCRRLPPVLSVPLSLFVYDALSAALCACLLQWPLHLHPLAQYPPPLLVSSFPAPSFHLHEQRTCSDRFDVIAPTTTARADAPSWIESFPPRGTFARSRSLDRAHDPRPRTQSLYVRAHIPLAVNLKRAEGLPVPMLPPYPHTCTQFYTR